MKFFNVLASAALFTCASAYAASFNQCPAVNNDTTGCEFLITVTASSGGAATAFTVSVSSPDKGPYDGADDTLVGVQNNSGHVLDSISISSPSDIFAFDGDGACTYIHCSGGADTSGYAAADMTFTGINAAMTSGTINFAGGISVGGSNWFSLEDALTVGAILPGTPEPASMFLLGLGLTGMGAFFRRRGLKK